ncbi:hypothetical protein HDG32_006492 [Paraburkholderia sp. CI2]|uniref:hypothetical protein n=1 Tax=unclassified Paraburkholderia TaxID=2615204 RepID=UPI0016157888|nr:MULTISPECIES: hypothetical protein [unclassified Paraburkholderia]MBB5470342.1 hypothetical protein [Paraburkholderia sp. CI2]MBC8730983.1 hypothetical protein [Paraburkholderia sp. UCT2]MBC8740030.1 hypothetical protein [Paraburkholderia sp. UCT31]
MTTAIKAIVAVLIVSASISVFADTSCEEKAKTRNDFLACTNADTEKILADAEKLYRGIRKITTGDKQIALDKNFEVWNEKISSDCTLIAYSFNEWSDRYAPDTGFQVAECRLKIASQEMEFYKWLACPGDMETSKIPKCAAINKLLRRSQ